MDPTTNPWVFSNENDSSHIDYPGQKIWIKRVVIFGGPADGNVMLLDHDGVQRAEAGGSGRHALEPGNQVDPRIVAEGSIAADTRTEVYMNRYVRGLFLDDIPDGGKVEVHHGRE